VAPLWSWVAYVRRLWVVGIDDIDMPAFRVLHDFLDFEEEWELVEVPLCWLGLWCLWRVRSFSGLHFLETERHVGSSARSGSLTSSWLLFSRRL
jgi:hypothetical protein